MTLHLHHSLFSAFGSTHPLHDREGERIRWFNPSLVSKPEDIARMLDDLDELASRLGVTRLTARAVSYGPLSPPCVEQIDERGFKVEAVMHLSGIRQPVISYLGKCLPVRASTAHDRQQEKRLIERVLEKAPRGPAAVVSRFNERRNFEVERIGRESLRNGDRESLASLHRATFPTFPYDFSEKFELMLGNPEIYIMAVVRSRSDGEILAFSNIEINDLVLDDGLQLRLAEYDNSMRRTSSSAHGDISGLGSILRVSLAQSARSVNADLCHSESRAGLVSINEIAHQVGMRFGGALEKHLLISGISDVRYAEPSRYETMNVWYLNRDDLMNF